MTPRPCQAAKFQADECPSVAEWFGFKIGEASSVFVCPGHKRMLDGRVEPLNTGPYWKQLSLRTWYYMNRIDGDEIPLGEIQHTAEGKYRFTDEYDVLYRTLAEAQAAAEQYVNQT